MPSDRSWIEQLYAYEKRNSYEIGDYVVTCTGHAGMIRSYAIMDSGDRYYSVQIFDSVYGMVSESQGGENMAQLPRAEDVLGDGYFS